MSYHLDAQRRDALGTGASRRLRREQRVPAVLYGDHIEPQNITIDHKTIFYALEREAFHTEVGTLSVDGTNYHVIVRDFQIHPFRNQVVHVDFQAIDLNKPLHIRVPIHLQNQEISPAVKLQGGAVNLLKTSVIVIALPQDIPQALILDVAEATAGKILHLSDLPLPPGVSLPARDQANNQPIASVTGKKR